MSAPKKRADKSQQAPPPAPVPPPPAPEEETQAAPTAASAHPRAGPIVGPIAGQLANPFASLIAPPPPGVKFMPVPVNQLEMVNVTKEDLLLIGAAKQLQILTNLLQSEIQELKSEKEAISENLAKFQSRFDSLSLAFVSMVAARKAGKRARETDFGDVSRDLRDAFGSPNSTQCSPASDSSGGSASSGKRKGGLRVLATPIETRAIIVRTVQLLTKMYNVSIPAALTMYNTEFAPSIKVTESNYKQWNGDIEHQRARGQQPGRKQKVVSDPREKETIENIKFCSSIGAAFNVTAISNFVASEWDAARLGCSPPSRSYVYSTMQKIGMGIIRASAKVLTGKQMLERREIARLELAYLVSVHSVDPQMIINFDESAVRLVPDYTYTWALNSRTEQQIRDILTILPKSKGFTTLTGACTMSGVLLAFMLNWLGKSENLYTRDQTTLANIANDKRTADDEFDDELLGISTDPTKQKPKNECLEYLNERTHWNTTASICAYIRRVVLPYVKSVIAKRERSRSATSYSNKFIILCDNAPTHASYEMRKAFCDEFAKEGGILHFLPPQVTGDQQPMDVGIFGPFKAALKKHQGEQLSGALKDAHENMRLEFLLPTKRARSFLVNAVDSASKVITPHAVKKSWRHFFANPEVATLSDSDMTMALNSLRNVADATMDAQKQQRETRISAVKEYQENALAFPREYYTPDILFRYGVPVCGDITPMPKGSKAVDAEPLELEGSAPPVDPELDAREVELDSERDLDNSEEELADGDY